MNIIIATIAFLLELVVFASYGSIGFVTQAPLAMQILLCILGFASVITFWGVYMSPKASKALSPRAHQIAVGVIYLVPLVLLVRYYGIWVGTVFAILTITTEIYTAIRPIKM